jgi:hypothetical protein
MADAVMSASDPKQTIATDRYLARQFAVAESGACGFTNPSLYPHVVH